ncbi:hypothetical protein ACHAW6_012476 [Cyclotella cf. meneghiniana]
MRLPLQPMSSADSGGVEIVPSRKVNEILTPVIGGCSNDVTGDDKMCDDGGNDENLLGKANCAVSSKGGLGKGKDTEDLIIPVSFAMEGLSLVERRAALFNNMQKMQCEKRTWSKPSKVGLGEGSNHDVKVICREHDGRAPLEQQKHLGISTHSDSLLMEEANKNTSSTHSRSSRKVLSPSNLDFESKKKAIFNFASQSTTRDFLGKGRGLKYGKSHFAVSETFDDEACVERTSAKASEKDDWRGGIILRSIDCDGGIRKEKVSPYDKDLDLKCSASIDVVKVKNSSDHGSTQKYPSPEAGATTAAVFSPSPHLLKPSQMNLKNLDLATFSELLFRNTPATSLARHDDDTHVISTITSRFESKIPTPLQIDEKRSDFASRISNVVSPNHFPSKFTDVVSSQTLSTPCESSSSWSHVCSYHVTSDHDDEKEIDVVAALSPHLLTPSRMNRARTIDTEKTDEVKSIDDLAVTVDEEITPVSKLFSDIIGFTSSFSEALVSPRNKCASSLRQKNVKSSTDDQGNTMNIETTTHFSSISKNRDTRLTHEEELFSDFADFTPVGATHVDSQNKMMEKEGFFDSPFTSTFDVCDRFSFPSKNIVGGENCIKEDKADNENTPFANFDSEWETSALTPLVFDEPTVETESVGGKHDENRKGLDDELNEILNITPPETPDEGQTQATLSNEVTKENDTTDSDTVFGSKFTELRSRRATCTEALDRIKQNNVETPKFQLGEELSAIDDEDDQDFVAQTKVFKDRLNPELCDLFTGITANFDRKVNELERKIKNTAVENTLIKEEMCHQHQQIQSLMVQLESSRGMVQVNQELMREIENLRLQLQASGAPQKRLRGKFIYGKKKINRTLKNIGL